MSTLRVSTIQDTAGSNSSTPAAIANGIAKAWVNFNGTGVVAIRAQYNVSSITDNGTGDYTVNFTTALADANYSWSYSMQYQRSSVTSETIYVTTKNGAASQTASVLRFTCNASSGSVFDAEVLSVAIFR